MPLFNVAVREHTYTGRFYSDVVQASSCEKALQAAAAPEPLPAPAPEGEGEAAGRPRCADVWVYALLHCGREAGHDPPHRAVAHGYLRPVWWERDDLGIARAVPAPVPASPRPPSRGSL